MSENYTAVWSRIATHWDTQIREGNDFQTALIMPTTTRLLELKPDQRVIDIGCGNGNYSRVMAAAGTHVVAVDAAETLIERAKKRTVADLQIEYRVLDATDENALAALGEQSFDAAVSSMALMDMRDIAGTFRGVRRLLKPGGRFVFSLSHPCFNSNESDLIAEMLTIDGNPKQVFGVRVTRYASDHEHLSMGLVNQPEPHWMFHRSLTSLLKPCFAAGFVVDAVEEPTFPPDTPAKNPFSWAKRPEIPPALVLRAVPVSPLAAR